MTTRSRFQGLIKPPRARERGLSLCARKARGRRGFALMLVIFTSMILLVLVMGYCYANTMAMQVSGNIRERAQARMIAESGMQAAMASLMTDPDWRGRFPGTWASDVSFAGGSFTVAAQAGEDTNGDGLVEGSGTFDGDVRQSVTLTGTGRYGKAFQAVRAVLRPQSITLGVYARQNMAIRGATVDSFDSSKGKYGGANVSAKADIGTMSALSKSISVTSGGKVAGDVEVTSGANPAQVVYIDGSSTLTGTRQTVPQVGPMPILTAPTGLGANTGDKSYQGNHAGTLTGNLHVQDFIVKANDRLFISGDVTVLVDGDVKIFNKSGIELLPGATLSLYVKGSTDMYIHGSKVQVNGPDLSRMRVYNLGSEPVTITDGCEFQGLIVSPKGDVVIEEGSEVFGAIIGKNVTIKGGSKFHEDKSITEGKTPADFPGRGFAITWYK